MFMHVDDDTGTIIARADCLVTGGVSGHYSVTCSFLVLFSLL